jgi:hypothetical protein
MARIFYIQKQSNSYSGILEAYGLGNLLLKILSYSELSRYKINIKNKENCYELESSVDISVELIKKCPFFYLYRFIIKDYNAIPEWVDKSFVYDYPKNKQIKDERREKENEIRKREDITSEQKRQKIRQLREGYLSENAFHIDKEYDVYNELRKNSYTYFNNKYAILHKSKDVKFFHILLQEIVNYYSVYRCPTNKMTPEECVKKILKQNKIPVKDDSNAQLLNPNQGQGVFKTKANGLNRENPPAFWINETMKIIGALDCNCMICQSVAVGSKYDLKIFVPEIIESDVNWITNFISDFKNNLKSNTPIRIDILNLLHLTRKFIEKNPKYIGEIHNTIKGLYVVYQKQLSSDKTKPKTVLNMSFMSVPTFIKIENEEQAYDWIEIIKDQISIISNIGKRKGISTEDGSTIYGLSLYRNFISGSDIQSFFDFSFWYASYIVTQLTKGEKIRLFSIETLNKFYINMDTQELKLSEIIDNDGFKAVANAIRKSTVTLLMNKKDAEYDIRYGVAQTLQSKAKSKEDLAEYIGDFISLYNSENAMKAADKKIKFRRSYVKDDELSSFYLLLDKFSSKLVGALLASYGFALTKKESQSDENEDEDDEIQNENIED